MKSYTNLGLSVLSGLLLSLAWPTYGFAGLLFFGFVPLLLVFKSLRDHNPKRIYLKSFGLAYVTFFLFNIIATYWLYYSTAFGMWFAVLANSALMALAFVIYQFIARRTSHRNSIIFLVALWIGFEKMHLHWELAWPWLNLGNGFSNYINWIQWYEYTGSFGGTLWVWVCNVLVFNTFLKWRDNRRIKNRQITLIVAAVVIPILLSALIKAQYDSFEKSTEIIVLQPNIDPYSEKYYTSDNLIAKNLFELTKQQKPKLGALVLAPETVFADGTDLKLFKNSDASKFSRQLVHEFDNINLLSGITMYERITKKSNVEAQTNFLRKGLWYNSFNSAFYATPGKTTQFYHKSKLVVGVENFPFKPILEPLLGDIMIDLGGTVSTKTTQEERHVFGVNQNLIIAPIICYESVFGEFVTGYVNNGATVLGIITNDAWWENTQGHKQHFSYAKIRAIETRRSVARSANTGISGFISPLGTVLKKSKYNERTSLKSSVPVSRKMTFYVKHGDYIARIAYFFILFIGIFAVIKHKRKVKR